MFVITQTCVKKRGLYNNYYFILNHKKKINFNFQIREYKSNVNIINI